jgi:tubulin beta
VFLSFFLHEASGGKYVLRALYLDLEPGVIDTLRASPLGELLHPYKLVKKNAGASNNWAKAHHTKGGNGFL